MDSWRTDAVADMLQGDALSREAWLNEQAEKLQNSIVNIHQGLSLTPSLYFGTRRCTYSDVVSIVTTVRRQTQSATPSKEKRRSTYSDTDTFNDPLYVNPLQNDRDKDIDQHQRYIKALNSERSVFMSKLQQHRNARHQIEYNAACVIQRTHRGHALRKNLDRLKKTLVIRNKVRLAMKDVTLGTGIILEEKDRTRARFKECTEAATKIQKKFRQLLSYTLLQKEKNMMREEVLNDCARTIQSCVRQCLAICYVRKIRLRHYEQLCLHFAINVQRLYRGYVARGVLRARRASVQTAAVRIIQNTITRSLAAKTLALNASRIKAMKQDAAAIFLQSWFRGHCNRLRVLKLRAVESEQISIAAAIMIQRVYRGRLDRAISSRRAQWRIEEIRCIASLALTRLARGFIGRRRAQAVRIEHEINVFIQARKGNRDAVVDLLDGLGIEAPLNPNGVDHNGNTVLCIASRFGHLNIARSVIARVRLNIANNNGMTAIMLAIKYGHAGVAEYLLTKGPELATTGRTVLHDAARNGMDSTIEQLVLHGLSVTTQDNDSKRTPLHEAVLSGNLSTVQLLLDNCPKAAINYQDAYGSTVLHYAAKSGFLKMVLLLLNAGVDVSILDNSGQTAWRVALSQGFEHVAGEIRKRWGLTDQHEEADITPDDMDEDNIVLTPMQRMVLAIEGPLSNFERLFDEGLNINDRDPEDGTTMLMKAAKKGFLTVVKFFMRHGANVALVDNRGRNALIHAAPHMDVAIYLLEQGADFLHQDDTGRTVIHEAAKYGYTFSEYIAVNGIFMDIKDSSGSTPLHDAAKVGSDIGAKKLLNVGAHVSCVDFDHCTPIHYSVQPAFSPATLRVLIHAEEPAIFLRDKHGRTVMFNAIISGNIPCVELLHAHGMLLTEKDTQDITLLHAAIQAKQTPSVEYLLSKLPVAEWTYPLKGSQDTPLHLACRLGYDIAVDKMLQVGGAILNTKVNAQGDTPLQTSARCGIVSSLKTFLLHGYDLTPIDKDSGQSLLHLAAEVDTDALDTELIPLLTNSGVSMTAFDKKGWQPLHVASARAKGAGVVRALLANGAPVNTPSKSNMTPYHCAAQMGIGEIVAILKDNGGR